jgi:hypothetical protein
MADEQVFAQDIRIDAHALEPVDWAGSETQRQGVVNDVQDWATDNGVTVSPQEAEYLVEKLRLADGTDAAVREDRLNELLDHYQAAEERGENPTWQGVAESLAQSNADPFHVQPEVSVSTSTVLPADIRQHAGYAVEAFDAFMAGKSIPQVALNYRYEPGQAEIFLRNVVQEYGVEELRGVVPGDILTTLDRERYGFVDRESARRTTQSAVAEIAAELSDYASHQTPLPYVNAEAAIATNFLQQLTNGSKTIDLSQRYATDDPMLAQERHEKALENLRPLIREASRLDGYTVQRGTAIANGLVEREVPAISQRQGQSVSA